MEIRLGYKPTDVGVIPEEWEVTSLSDLITEFRGGASLKPSDFTTTGVKVLPKGGVGHTGWLQVEADKFQYCSPYYAAAHRNNQVDKSYTIVVLRDLVPSGPSIGLIVQIKEAETYILAQGVYAFKVNERAEPRYLVQLSNTHWYRQLMNSIMVGSTQVHITNTAFKREKIPLPKLSEQRVIATALSDVDGLLSGLDRLIAKKRDLKQAAMQQLLTGQTRLPGFHGEWEVKRLGDVVQIKKGQLITSSTLKPGDIPVIAGGKQPAYYHASANRFGRTVTISASGASAGYVALYDEPIFASDCSTISESESYCLDFVFYQLLCKQQTIYKAQTGGAQPHIHPKDLNPILFSLPPLAEQTAIASVLTEMDAELAALEQRREKTRAIKQAMMQELLTGRTRII